MKKVFCKVQTGKNKPTLLSCHLQSTECGNNDQVGIGIERFEKPIDFVDPISISLLIPSNDDEK